MPEAYCLGDLEGNEIEEYEAHFFDCPECGFLVQQVTALSESMDHSAFRKHCRSLFEVRKRRSKKSRV